MEKHIFNRSEILYLLLPQSRIQSIDLARFLEHHAVAK
jgi:hypothetical protein